MESKVENKMINKYQNVQIMDFGDITDFVEYIVNLCNNIEALYKIDKDADTTVIVFGKSEFIANLFTILMRDYFGFNIGLLDFGNGIYNQNGDNEYALSISCFNGLTISIESAYNEEDKPFDFEGYLFYNQYDCKQIIIDKALDDDKIVTIFGFEYDEDSNEDESDEDEDDFKDDGNEDEDSESKDSDCKYNMKHHKLIIRDGNTNYIFNFDKIEPFIKEFNEPESESKSDSDTNKDIEKDRYDSKYHYFIGTKHLSDADYWHYLLDIFGLI